LGARVGEHDVGKFKARFNKLRPISQIIEFPEYSWNANLHLQEFLCQYVRLDYTECARKVKEHETDVGTRFVQMRMYVMQNSILYSPPSSAPPSSVFKL